MDLSCIAFVMFVEGHAGISLTMSKKHLAIPVLGMSTIGRSNTVRGQVGGSKSGGGRTGKSFNFSTSVVTSC